MELTKQSCEDFLDVLASKEPVPGGGGAAALVGAVGVALGHMVGALTVGKKKYADVQEDILALNARAEALRARLVELVEEDARAFEPLSRAYAIPKDDPTRGEVMEQCLRDAAAAPMAILRLCCQAIDLHREMLDKGGATGRKLDFLIQEFNREANTIGSKCSDIDIARHVVDIKAEIEKIREQVQNIE